jgi:uncharacterized protein YbaP (TraB family)
MKLRRLIATAAAAGPLLLSGASAHAQPVAAPAEVMPADAVAGPALWKVADADTTIYLFGTVHALPKDKQWYDGRIARAFEGADELVTEIDVADLGSSAQALASEGTLPQGQSLRDLMTGEDRQKFEAALVSLGLPVEALDRYEPWFAAMTLSLLPLLRTGYDTQSGVEQTLSGRPGSRTHAGLETMQDQIGLFDTMPIPQQLSFLEQTVDALPKASASLDAMVAEWLKGDAGKLAELLNAELTDPDLRQRLLTNRNGHWAQWIVHRLEQPGTVFVAVGAGHLAGDGSVQEQLGKLGIPVQRVWQ